MANLAPFESFPVPSSGPYLYDDPRLLYDENCFFYDGGYDLYCLYEDPNLTARRRFGKSSTKTVAKTYPQPEMINLLFKSRLDFVNDENHNEKWEMKKYKFEKHSNVDVSIKNLKTNKRKIILTSEFFSPTIINRHLQVEELSVKKTKIAVSSSFKLSRPRKIKFNSTIFKKK